MHAEEGEAIFSRLREDCLFFCCLFFAVSVEMDFRQLRCSGRESVHCFLHSQWKWTPDN